MDGGLVLGGEAVVGGGLAVVGVPVVDGGASVVVGAAVDGGLLEEGELLVLGGAEELPAARPSADGGGSDAAGD